MALWTPKLRNYYAPFGAMDPKVLKMNAHKCRTLGTTRARILKSARATEMRVMESIRKICEQKRETKEKEAHCLTLSRIPGSA